MTPETDYLPLKAAIRGEDQVRFLRLYLTAIKHGAEMGLPDSDREYDIKYNWEDLLIRFNEPMTDAFLNKLTKLWGFLLKDPTFRRLEKPTLDQLINRLNARFTDAIKAPIHNNVLNDQINVTISTDYTRLNGKNGKSPSQ